MANGPDVVPSGRWIVTLTDVASTRPPVASVSCCVTVKVSPTQRAMLASPQVTEPVRSGPSLDPAADGPLTDPAAEGPDVEPCMPVMTRGTPIQRPRAIRARAAPMSRRRGVRSCTAATAGGAACGSGGPLLPRRRAEASNG
jgi:hypothetical protein